MIDRVEKDEQFFAIVVFSVFLAKADNVDSHRVLLERRSDQRQLRRRHRKLMIQVDKQRDAIDCFTSLGCLRTRRCAASATCWRDF